MEINYATLEDCHLASGTVVVIDVLRAFTVSAYAFDAGASEIILTGTVTDALKLRERFPGSLLMGEVDGLPIPEFDVGNSPSALEELDIKDKRIIHRTSAGTQGVLRSRNAGTLWVSSLVCAQATARAILRENPASVTFVITGILAPRDGDEDRACADYISLLLQNQPADLASLEWRVRNSYSGRLFSSSNTPELPSADLELALHFNRFSFAQKVICRDGLLVLMPVREHG